MNAGTNSDTSDRTTTRKVALILFAAGMSLLVVHYFLLQTQQTGGDENWQISMDITLDTKSKDTTIRIQPPYESEYIRIVGRSINHPGLSIVPSPRSSISRRTIQLRAGDPGIHQVSVEFSLLYSRTPHFHPLRFSALTTEKREYFLSDHELLQLDDPAFDTALTEIGLDTAGKDMHAERIFAFVQGLALNVSPSRRTAPEVLTLGSGNHYERALLMVALCRKADTPARIVSGLKLKDDLSVSPDYWVEVNIKDRWVTYHPGLGYKNSLPANYVAMDKLGIGIVSAHSGGSQIDSAKYTLDYDILVERAPETIKGPDNTRQEWYQIFILDRLPADARQELALLMLLPLGALLTGLIRQFSGLHSYGVFTPTILALAMVYADWQTTLLMLTVILLLVYFGRPAFHPKMPRTPRLSIVFTLVAISMVMGVSILDYFSLSTDGHLILLPIVILTSLIDRFFSTVESLGYHTAFIRLVWTLVITMITVPILQLQWLGNLILRYPEFHLLTLSTFILISSYPVSERKLPGRLSILIESQNSTKKKTKKPS